MTNYVGRGASRAPGNYVGTIPEDTGAAAPGVPVGTVIDFAGAAVPAGWLACDGAAVLRATYAALFTALGGALSPWGLGDGSTTFNVPDMRGRAAIGAGTGTAVATGGAAQVSAATDRFTVPANDDTWKTGMPAVLTFAGGTLPPLVSGTLYYVRRQSATEISLCTTLANAQNGTVVNITAVSATSWTITRTRPARVVGQVGGDSEHAMSDQEMLAHAHAGSTTTARATTTKTGPEGSAAGTDVLANPVGGVTIASDGGNVAMNIQNPFGVFNKIIKATA